MARADLIRASSSLDGDSLLALVNRSPTGALPPNYAPRDLVDLATGRTAGWRECTPPRKQCLRREAAGAYRAMAAAMEREGLSPYVSSAFRAYRVQCATFQSWADRDGFCATASTSALPGHSQHQLGTTIDLFTREWMEGGNKFRAGYGCSEGGRWLEAHAGEYGFVLPYPLHPDYRRGESSCAAVDGGEERIDPRTGYRYEPWHLRFIGVENARRFERAQADSGPNTPSEITLEQWLRREHGIAEAIGAPVCDGCNCDRCATYAAASGNERSPCERPAMVLDEEGRPQPASELPRLLSARLERAGEQVQIVVRVHVPQNTWTQPPIVTSSSGAVFRRGQSAVHLPGRGPRHYPTVEGTWRLVVGFEARGRSWPWRLALVQPSRDGTDNGVNARLPAAPGEIELRVPMEGVTPGTLVRVALARNDEVRFVQRLVAP